MVIEAFPPVETADRDGVLAIGGDLEPESLLLAYRSGIFPWPLNEELLAWFAPPRRALLFYDSLHISRTLQKVLRRSEFEITWNQDFAGVISSCAELKNRRDQDGTWITDDVMTAYKELHRRGYAQSIEARMGGTLVGGLYGVTIGGMFAGESMFYREPNASKIALIALMEKLASKGSMWLDCQVITPHMKEMGAKLIPRSRYMELLQEALQMPQLLLTE